MTTRKYTKRFINDVDVSAAGEELSPGIFHTDYKYYRLSGVIQQIVIEKTAGAATSIDVEIRYESGNSGLSNLVYKYTGGTLDFSDSSINAPFSLGGPNFYDDLYLYINPDAAATFNIRIDVEIDVK